VIEITAEARAKARALVFTDGAGDGERTACVVSAASVIAGEAFGDSPSCVCPVLRRIAIRANDTAWWGSNEERTRVLFPLAERLVGTRSTLAVEIARARRAAHWACTVATPMALESAASALETRDELREHGAILRRHAQALRERGAAAATAAAYRAAATAATADAADPKRAARDALLGLIDELIDCAPEPES
jgi:hypothetical protein